MKKSLFLGITLAMLSSSALAYTNEYAGFSIKNEEALQTRVEAARFYAYTSHPQAEQAQATSGQTVHAVGYFTAEEMTEAIGEPFTTAYFNQQYDNLALLGRCKLDLRTVPVKLLDLANYAELGEQNIYARSITPLDEIKVEKIMEALEKEAEDEEQAKSAADVTEEDTTSLEEEEETAAAEEAEAAKAKSHQEEELFEPWVRVDKIGKERVITISQYYHQQKLRTDKILVAHTSLLSKNDRLYALTTYNYEVVSPETKKLERKYFKQSLADKYPQLNTAQNKQKLEPFAEAKKEGLNEKFSPQVWQEHKQLVESFRFLKPQETAKELSFTDPLFKRSFALPQDWFYMQLSPEGRAPGENLVLAASYPKFAQLFSEDSSVDIAQFLEQTVLTAAQGKAPLEVLNKERLLKLCQGLDQVLLSGSFAVEDKELAAILSQPEEAKPELEMFLRDSMDRLHSLENGLYRIHGYGYETAVAKDQAVADLDVHMQLLDQYEFTNQVRLTFQKDKGNVLWLLETKNLPSNNFLAEQIDKWQF